MIPVAITLCSVFYTVSDVIGEKSEKERVTMVVVVSYFNVLNSRKLCQGDIFRLQPQSRYLITIIVYADVFFI